MGVMGILPGFPHIILFLLAAGMAGLGYSLYQSSLRKAELKPKVKEEKEQRGPENVNALLKVDPLSLYIGYELIPLVDKAKGAELLNSITSISRPVRSKISGSITSPVHTYR